MKKKVLATLLSATMVAGMLAGCGSNEAAPETTETTETTEETTEEAADVDVAQADASAVDALIAATTDTVSLTVWASEEDQDLTNELLDNFKNEYSDVTFDIQLGSESESTAKDTVLTDIEAAADVYAFADDQINDLVAAGALQPVSATYTYDVANENVAGSVEAASVDGTLYAYPMTADNGYFMFYNSEYFTEDDVQSLDAMIEVAKANDKKIAMDVSNGWYIYAFFKGAGLDAGLNEDGSTNYCEWDGEGGADVCQSILDLFATGAFVDMGDEDMATAIAEGTVIAGVNGTWRAETAQDAWGENYAAAKLPTFTLNGEQAQMSSYSGYKLLGVNPHSSNVGWAMLLAEYLTNEASQVARYEARGLGPANVTAASSDAVQSDPAIAALAAQAEFATPQRIGGNFWSPAETLGSILAGGNADGTDLQELLTTAVDGITAPVAE